jgi:hypothetical protein
MNSTASKPALFAAANLSIKGISAKRNVRFAAKCGIFFLLSLCSARTAGGYPEVIYWNKHIFSGNETVASGSIRPRRKAPSSPLSPGGIPPLAGNVNSYHEKAHLFQ